MSKNGKVLLGVGLGMLILLASSAAIASYFSQESILENESLAAHQEQPQPRQYAMVQYQRYQVTSRALSCEDGIIPGRIASDAVQGLLSKRADKSEGYAIAAMDGALTEGDYNQPSFPIMQPTCLQ